MQTTILLLLIILIALAVIALLAWKLFRRPGPQVFVHAAELAEAKMELRAKETMEKELRGQLGVKDTQIEELRASLDAERSQKAAVEAKYAETRKNIEEQKKLLDDANRKLSDAFKAISSDVLKDNSRMFLELSKKTVESLVSDMKGDFGKNKEAMEGVLAPIKESLQNYEKHIRELERARESAYGGLRQQIDQLSNMQSSLQKETANLVLALKSPKVKGRWGEVALRRLVEVAGMSEYCDFEEQVSVNTEDGRSRPDLIVRLPAQRNIVVDSKVPFKHYMDAAEAASEEEKNELIKKHSKAIRDYMQQLCSKTYWSQFSPTPDFVIMFIPAESFLSAALVQDGDLIEDGMKSNVILATPTTLIAMLKTVSYVWYQQKIGENSLYIAELGRDLYDRLCKFTEHLGSVGGGLEQARKAFNSAVSSWESRLMPSARKFKELGASSDTGKEIPALEKIDAPLKHTQ